MEKKIDFSLTEQEIMVQKVMREFAEKEIDVLVGISGKIDEVLDEFAGGKLTGGKNPCKPGSGKGYGIKKKGGE